MRLVLQSESPRTLGCLRPVDALFLPDGITMLPYPDSTDRGPADFLLFGMAFLGFLIGAGGVELNSVPLAIFGGLLLLVTVFSLGCRSGESH